MFSRKLTLGSVAAVAAFCLAHAAPAQILIPFNVVAPAGPWGVGAAFTTPDVDPAGGMPVVQFAGRGFHIPGAGVFAGGFAQRLAAGFTGSPTLQMNSICVAPNIAAFAPLGIISIDFDYRDTGAPINLFVQTAAGAVRMVAPDFAAIPAGAFPGVVYNHTIAAWGAGWVEGHVTVSFAGSLINNIQIGGQNLQIDNVVIN